MADDGNTKKRLGDFEIIRELGRGGMGIVYEARQVSLNRKVALKVISGSLGLSSKAVLRFQREAEAAGKLHHTNIVPIYATGNDDGAHYYAMELIDGPSLHQVIRSLRSGDRKSAQVSGSAATMAVGVGPIEPNDGSEFESSAAVETPPWVSEILGSPPISGKSTPAPKSSAGVSSSTLQSSSSYFDSVATMIAGVAEALDYAHENGVIHRDIKPANLLLSRDGRVSINDFGLARMLEQPGMTMSGEFVGSPLYMSPEQITAGRAPLDHRTDIYSLGATLYELLTLKPVFPGRSRDEVIGQILHKEPERPRRQNPKVPIDLETICLKAMEKDPDRRYQSAGQLTEDLRRFVSRHAISARRAGPVERAIRWGRKNPALTAMGAITMIALLVAGGFTYWSWSENRNVQLEREKGEALTSAMEGNFEGATTALEKARAFGASEEWSFMVSGLVNLYRGDAPGGLEQIRAAVAANPDNVTAQAILADALVENGRFAEFSRLVDEIARMPARSDLEKMFKGYAIALHTLSTRQGLDLMDEAIDVDRQGFPIARVLRATMLVFVAQDRLDLGMIRKAEEDLDHAKAGGLAENPRQLQTRLMLKLSEHNLHLHAKQMEDARRSLEACEELFKALESHGGFLFGNHQRLLYLSTVHDIAVRDADSVAGEAALRSLQEVMDAVTRHGHGGFVVDPYASTSFRARRSREGLESLRLITSDDQFTRLSKMFLYMDDPETRPRALELAREGRDGFAISVLYLLGEPRKAREAAEALVEVSRNWKLSIHEHAVHRYQAGLIDESELLDPFEDSEIDKSRTYFHIGLRQLARGRRNEALQTLGKGARSVVYNWTEVQWARALVARMKEDASWPDWIPRHPDPADAK